MSWWSVPSSIEIEAFHVISLKILYFFKEREQRSLHCQENNASMCIFMSNFFASNFLTGHCWDTPQNLCLDAAYVGKEDTVVSNGFIPHIRPRGEEKQLIEKDPSFKARRWVVELAHSWFNRFRKLIPRYEKTDLSYIARNTLAAAMIVLNKVMVIYR